MKQLFLFLFCLVSTITSSQVVDKCVFDFTSPQSLNPSITPLHGNAQIVMVTDKVFKNGPIYISFKNGSVATGAQIVTTKRGNSTETYNLRITSTTTMTIFADEGVSLKAIQMSDDSTVGDLSVTSEDAEKGELDGYVDKIFAGNALATHDIEQALYGTSLGVDINTGKLVAHGHKNHMAAINQINKAGSIRDAVEQGVLKSGVMYECIKNDATYVLAGSIRDDGPLPDVITDSQVAQQRMREEVQDKDVEMVIMVATLLHSVATGNLMPARIKSVCVDINNASVTKLSDRGSAQVISIVTDIGTFFPTLESELRKLEEE